MSEAHASAPARWRLFIAVWPPPAVIEEVARLERPERAGIRWTSHEQWHVTLRFLGEVPQTASDAVVDALAGVNLPVVTAELGQAVTRLGRAVLCVPVTGLEPLADRVVSATASQGRPPEHRPFRGHITLARASQRGADLRSLSAYPGMRLAPVSWPVTAVVLVRSHLGRARGRYENLATIDCR